jgi:GNAT superfamily N-acetyltransferase
MNENAASICSVRLLARPDRAAWRVLYGGYTSFYSVPMTDEIADRVWNWLMDPTHALVGYVAETPRDGVIGIAHVRAYPRSLSGTWAGFLDDLYVDPAHRGRGIGRSLLEAVALHARTAGWTFVRWMTADDNRTAQYLYDRLAMRTRWITYQLDPEAVPHKIEGDAR